MKSCTIWRDAQDLGEIKIPGYNHFPWCLCGWCYKTGSNGYSLVGSPVNFDKWSALKKITEYGVDRSWSACFINYNARCPVCGAQVFFYANAAGSRVFFDNVGWPWPKHECTDRSKRRYPDSIDSHSPFQTRKLGVVTEISEALRAAEVDPFSDFRQLYGRHPLDLLQVVRVFRIGFENFIEAKYIFPMQKGIESISFTSARYQPEKGDFFSIDESHVYFREPSKPFRFRKLDPNNNFLD